MSVEGGGYHEMDPMYSSIAEINVPVIIKIKSTTALRRKYMFFIFAEFTFLNEKPLYKKYVPLTGKFVQQFSHPIQTFKRLIGQFDPFLIFSKIIWSILAQNFLFSKIRNYGLKKLFKPKNGQNLRNY